MPGFAPSFALPFPGAHRAGLAGLAGSDLEAGLLYFHAFHTADDTGTENSYRDYVGSYTLEDSNNAYQSDVQAGGTRGNELYLASGGVEVVTPTTVSLAGDRTFKFDFRMAATDTSGSDVAVWQCFKSTALIKVEWTSDDKLRVTYNGQAHTTGVLSTATTYTLVFGHGDGKAFFYLDGTLVGDTTTTQLTDTGCQVIILNTEGDQVYETEVDEHYAWTRRLNPTEITALETTWPDVYLVDENGDFIVDENGDNITEF